MIRSSRLLLFFRGRTENVQCIKKHVLKVFFASRPQFSDKRTPGCGEREARVPRERRSVFTYAGFKNSKQITFFLQDALLMTNDF